MNKKNQKTVVFDPGFSTFYNDFDYEIFSKIDDILRLKTKNQVKFQLRLIEPQLVKPFTYVSLIYYGCVIYGSILSSKYKTEPALLDNNPFIGLTPEEKSSLNITNEAKTVLAQLRKTKYNTSILLKKESALPDIFYDYINTYIEFIELNNQFIDITRTDQIKLPAKTQHFYTYSPEKLQEIETEVFEIIKQRELEKIVNIS